MNSEDRVKWRQLVHGVAKPRNEDGWRQSKPSFYVIYGRLCPTFL